MNGRTPGDETASARTAVAETAPVAFVHALDYAVLPEEVVATARTLLLDLIGVAAAGSRTRLSAILRDHAAQHFAPGRAARGVRMLFDGRRASPVGAALAGAGTIDGFDAHDGHRLTKGHVGVTVLPALLALADSPSTDRLGAAAGEREFLAALVVGYELGTRAGIAAHRLASEYHASGSWNALAAAAVGARWLALGASATREALGIAEYHAPIGSMMRCIDHPSMVKDGSAPGAAAGVSAALLAAGGFTGAPAAIVESPAVADLWSDLGIRWRLREQYLKPWPVCRWAQPAVTAALALRSGHGIEPETIRAVSVRTFHEASRLAGRRPATTEAAQYSLPFPVAAALVRGRVTAEEVTGALGDEALLRVSERVHLEAHAEYSARFPAERLARVSVRLEDGRELVSPPTAARGDADDPLDERAVSDKFHALAALVVGSGRARALESRVRALGEGRGGLSGILETVLSRQGG